MNEQAEEWDLAGIKMAARKQRAAQLFLYSEIRRVHQLGYSIRTIARAAGFSPEKTRQIINYKEEIASGT